MPNKWKPVANVEVLRPDPRVLYQPRNIVSEYEDEHGEVRVIHAPKGRSLRRFDASDTPIRRMNRAVAILLGENVRKRRQKAGLSMTQLCLRAGIVSTHPKNYIRAIEVPPTTRLQTIRMGTLFALCTALDCEPWDLLPTADEVRAIAGVQMETVETLTSGTINGSHRRASEGR